MKLKEPYSLIIWPAKILALYTQLAKWTILVPAAGLFYFFEGIIFILKTFTKWAIFTEDVIVPGVLGPLYQIFSENPKIWVLRNFTKPEFKEKVNKALDEEEASWKARNS